MEEFDATGDLPDVGLAATVQSDAAGQNDKPQAERELVKRLLAEIEADKRHFAADFKRMREDMFIAREGRTPDWPVANYKANITGRHINQSVAALYAKNPRAVARRRETLDFQVWDEDDQSLLLAMQTVQTMSAAVQVDPMTGQTIMPPGLTQAVALLKDFEAGMMRRERIKKIGRTLELLYSYFTQQQRPLDLKTSMKQLVRRTKTTGVGWIELGFERAMGPDPMVSERLQDARTRLAHLESLVKQATEGEISADDGEMEELRQTVASLEQPVIVREGLVMDFPQSTKVIPDRMTRSLIGLVGCRHLSIEYTYSKEEVKDKFGVDLPDTGVKWYSYDGKSDPDTDIRSKSKSGKYACVYKHYDKSTGMVYYVAEGYDGYLRPPSAPDVTVEDFWPVYALSFNEVEDEKCLFPPSDVRLMMDMQKEYNRARDGQRAHRWAARPRHVIARGALDNTDIETLMTMEPHEAAQFNVTPGQSIADLIQPIPHPGVDPNLYETGPIFQDIQLVVGTQESMLGGLAKATATETSIAANASISAMQSNIDDLDNFLTRLARASGQILLREMSVEQVMRIAGPGATWPTFDDGDIAAELHLEIEAGSSGKPNQAQEINNWERMLPFLIQMPSISPVWLARESIRRLDDRIDLTEAIAANVPAIVAQNRMAQPGPADPAADPAQQGGEGADNTPAPPGGPAGTDAPMGGGENVTQFDASTGGVR